MNQIILSNLWGGSTGECPEAWSDPPASSDSWLLADVLLRRESDQEIESRANDNYAFDSENKTVNAITVIGEWWRAHASALAE